MSCSAPLDRGAKAGIGQEVNKSQLEKREAVQQYVVPPLFFWGEERVDGVPNGC